jgi:hypothetical protein
VIPDDLIVDRRGGERQYEVGPRFRVSDYYRHGVLSIWPKVTPLKTPRYYPLGLNSKFCQILYLGVVAAFPDSNPVILSGIGDSGPDPKPVRRKRPPPKVSLRIFQVSPSRTNTHE